MDTINYSNARQNLATLLEKVSNDRAPVEIIRRDKPSAILIDKDDYDSMVETLYVLSSSVNAARLNESIVELESGGGLIETIADN